MPVKLSFKEMDIGAIYKVLASFAKGPEVEQKLKSLLDVNIVTLGQGGGRKGAEMGRFGWDIWMVNSATVDMAEHDWIERKIKLEDPDRGKLEGTAKNAGIGHAIAQKNVAQFKKIAVETQDSDLVMVTVALGGGQGNGAIPTATEWLIKVRELAGKKTEKDNSTIVVVASLPTRDEANPDIWRNALSGIKLLQDLINQKKIGSVILVDNELIRNYYERNNPLVYNGKTFSALDYSNIMLARTFFEVMVLPLLSGPVSMDSAELMEILTTPGWLTINRTTLSFKDDIDVEREVELLFNDNEVFASLDISSAIAGGIALVTSKSRVIAPSIIDSVKPVANKILGKPSILHSAVIQSNSITDTSYLLGLAVAPSLPDSITQSLMNRYEEEKRRKEERELAARQASAALAGFDDVFSQASRTTEKKRISLDDLEMPAPQQEKKKITIDDLE
ncbi:hypothetical protein ACFPOG_12670 [Paenibacillus aestuarii]|uniref:Cell division protein FtsZ n=1 Tax=Paenibacillus aestuarii TaxID=516965 RepID=A0ABW0K6S6_9BACL